MKIKTSELTGAALNWAVAKCEGKVEQDVYGSPELLESGLHLHYCDVLLSHPYSPSTDWAEGGPLIHHAATSLLCASMDSITPRAGSTQRKPFIKTDPAPQSPRVIGATTLMGVPEVSKYVFLIAGHFPYRSVKQAIKTPLFQLASQP